MFFSAISDDAERELIEGYLEMRRLGGNAKTITATPRQLESLIRLSEALARMKWAPVVERSDVVEAIRLMKVFIDDAFNCLRSVLCLHHPFCVWSSF